ncbi:MAG: hypothetical protein EBR59_10555, partial [Methylococcaceae bacterium]|nr:hypothetical protein [Methylococcaceae bacterium]
GNTEIHVQHGEFLNGGQRRPLIETGDNLTIEAQTITNEGLLRAEDGNLALHAQTGIYNYGTIETPNGETEIDVPNGEWVNGRPQPAAQLPTNVTVAPSAQAIRSAVLGFSSASM